MPPAIPVATYRLQLTANFDFDAAAAVVPYLKALGISHLYASPFMKARKGSTHGYDIVDHTQSQSRARRRGRFRAPERGAAAARSRPDPRFRARTMSACISPIIRGGLTSLEWGQASPHAVSFDIDWELLPYRARGGVLLPIIGSSYGEALEKGEIELRYDAGEGSFSAWYFEHRLPIAPERYSEILRTSPGKPAPKTAAGRQRILDLASRYKGLRHPNRKEAPAFKAELKAIEGGAEIIDARACRLSRRTRSRRADAGAASSAGAPALQARPLAARLQRHQLSPLLRCQYARRPAGRGCRARSTPSIAWSGS